MNGLTGRKIQQIYEDVAPEDIRYDARSLVEYACFRYLSRGSSIIRGSLNVSYYHPSPHTALSHRLFLKDLFSLLADHVLWIDGLTDKFMTV